MKHKALALDAPLPLLERALTAKITPSRIAAA